jgi:hypothetical protein
MTNIDELRGLRSVLNLGAGRYADFNGRPDIWGILEQYLVKVALDGNPEKAKQWVGSGWVPLQLEIYDELPLPDNSFDVVIGTDFLEHLRQRQMELIVEEAERVASKYVIWFTPKGFIDVRIYQAHMIEHPLDIHQIGIEPEFFANRGYEVEVLKDFHNLGEDAVFDAILARKVMI